MSIIEHWEKLSVHLTLIISSWKVWFWDIIHCFLFPSPGGSKSIANAKFVKGFGPNPWKRSTAHAKWLCSIKTTMGVVGRSLQSWPENCLCSWVTDANLKEGAKKWLLAFSFKRFDPIYLYSISIHYIHSQTKNISTKQGRHNNLI